MINRYQMMLGKKVVYIPGWDCHGLPIELKALTQLNKKHKKVETRYVLCFYYVFIGRAVKHLPLALKFEKLLAHSLMNNWKTKKQNFSAMG